MADQLSLIAGEPASVAAVDHSRAALEVAKPAPRRIAKKVATVLQFDLVPILRRSKSSPDSAAHRREMARDLADYLAEHPEMRAPIRSKRKKVSIPRMGREGDRPESLGTGPLTDRERNEMNEDVFILETEGVAMGPPKTFGDCKKSGPCVRISCRHNNYLEVDGPIIKLNFPHLEPGEMKEPCSLRVAKRVSLRVDSIASHEEVSAHLGLAAERTRGIENVVIRRIKKERPDLK